MVLFPRVGEVGQLEGLLKELQVKRGHALLAVIMLWDIIFGDIHAVCMLPDFAGLAHYHQPSLIAV
jgi:hypothetical protein